jgi:hypothetical protein
MPARRAIRPELSRLAAALLLALLNRCPANQELLLADQEGAQAVLRGYLHSCGDAPTQASYSTCPLPGQKQAMLPCWAGRRALGRRDARRCWRR